MGGGGGGGGRRGELLGILRYMVSICLVLHTFSVFLYFFSRVKKRISRVLIFANDETCYCYKT